MATVKKNAKNTKKKASTKTTPKTVSKKVVVEESEIVSSPVEEKTVKKEVKESKEGQKKEVKKVSKKKNEKKDGIFTKIKTFFHEVKKEMSYVKWPSRKDMVKYSVATICFVLFFSLFFYLVDLIVAAVKTWV